MQLLMKVLDVAVIGCGDRIGITAGRSSALHTQVHDVLVMLKSKK